MFFIDPGYIIMVMLPGFIMAGLASWMCKSTFAKYSRVPAYSGITGAEAARRLLNKAGITYVKIEKVSGFLSDHYDPLSKTLRLSPEVYGSYSLSAIGVACHEAGHAIQHAGHYFPLHLRSGLVPLCGIGSNLAWVLIILGGIFSPKLLLLGAVVFSSVVLFSIVTLPVEWDASARAKKLMVSAGIVTHDEASAAGKVLNAAFLTYLAAAAQAILTLLYFLLRAGVFGSDD